MPFLTNLPPNRSLRPAQWQVFTCPRRFRVLVAGRRFGKTELALCELMRACYRNRGAVAWYVAPSYRQAKRIAWSRLKDFVRGDSDVTISETDLSIHFHGAGSIALRGADNVDSLRGNGIDFVVLDEFASMRPEVWTEVLRPALADRGGRALFIGTPQGHNHLYERFEYAQNHSLAGAGTPEGRAELAGSDRAVAEPSDAQWAAFKFTTLEGGNVTEEELSSAASELDERLFRQEFEASFETTALGRAYHAFNRDIHVRPCSYTQGGRLIWSLDFNVNPMCSVIAQRSRETVEVLDELVIENANTWLACQQFWQRVQRYRHHYGALVIDIYGDASGHQRRTSGSDTDWNIIRHFFLQIRGQATANVKALKSNPGLRDRINIVNGRLFNASSDARLFIDPRCKELVADFERVCWLVDSFGQPASQLDKSDRTRTHTSDALGYYLAQAFPITAKIGPQPVPLL